MKINLKFSLVCLALIVALSGCQLAQVTPTPVVWQEFKSSFAGFSVLMPGIPKQETRPVGAAIGQSGASIQVGGYFYTVEKGDQIYSVVYEKYPALFVENSDPQHLLDIARDDILKKVNEKMQVKLQDDFIITLGKYPGREIVMEASDGQIIRCRFYFVIDQLYQISTFTSRSDASSKEVNDFLDSFKLNSE